MANRTLASQHDQERATAVRTLLATPLLDSDRHRDRFSMVIRHQGWLTDWFDSTCGWHLSVDPAAGFARLAKRTVDPDPTRPLRRPRGAEAPFDRRRYQILCLVCAELVRRPVSTVGLLAQAVAPTVGLDTARHGDRAAFVDALLILDGWGVVRATAGTVETFLDDQRANALLTADTARLHRLLVSAMAPSGLEEGFGQREVTACLLAEPRYGDPATATEDQRLRWVRHTLARRLLDDPVLHLEDLSPTEQAYLANPSGRRWLRDRIEEAGFELEERADGLLAVDLDALATDMQFPAPLGNPHQLALLLIDRLVTSGDDGRRRVGVLLPAALGHEVAEVLAAHPGWARSHREGDGPAQLAAAAVAILVAFGLARCESDGTVVGRPVVARYRVGDPVTSPGPPTLFEESV